MKSVHQENTLPIGPLMSWAVLVIFIGLLGLCYVHMKHKLKVEGDRCRELELAVADLNEKLKVAGNEITHMASRPALERRRQEGFIRMIPVQDARMVRLRVETGAAVTQVARNVEDRP
ncbi:MAG: hypothetical protein ACOYOL_08600 [Chthoniobacterales bacterium]|jgi:hypothetical protein